MTQRRVQKQRTRRKREEPATDEPQPESDRVKQAHKASKAAQRFLERNP